MEADGGYVQLLWRVAAQGKGSSLKRDVEILQLSKDTKSLFAGHLGN